MQTDLTYGDMITIATSYTDAGQTIESNVLQGQDTLLDGLSYQVASAFEKKKQVGAALGFAILLYVADLLCRMIPDLEGLKYLTPYYYSNGTDIFTGGRTQTELMGIGLLVLAAAALAAYVVYKKKDLTA